MVSSGVVFYRLLNRKMHGETLKKIVFTRMQTYWVVRLH